MKDRVMYEPSWPFSMKRLMTRGFSMDRFNPAAVSPGRPPGTS